MLFPVTCQIPSQSGDGGIRRQDWDEAQARFENCLQISGEDGPSSSFLERIARLRRVRLFGGYGAIKR
jgi:hypothetical protein